MYSLSSLSFSSSVGNGVVYRLRALFGDQDALAEGTHAESLLLAAVGLADRRRAEMRVTPTQTPLVRLLYAVMGFMQDGADLVRPPLSDVVRGEETLNVVLRQIGAHWSAHRDTHLLNRFDPPPAARVVVVGEEEEEEKDKETTATATVVTATVTATTVDSAKPG
jgi:hypothetical protein